MNTQTLNDKEFAQQESVYEYLLRVYDVKESVYDYLLRVYDVKDDLTKCTLWEMVKNGLFDDLIKEKNLLPF